MLNADVLKTERDSCSQRRVVIDVGSANMSAADDVGAELSARPRLRLPPSLE